MGSRIEDYSNRITGESKAELERIGAHFTGKQNKPFLVGGWAVYYHTAGGERPPATAGQAVVGKSNIGDRYGFEPLGSKDIDLIFPNKDAKDAFVWGYCKKNGFKPTRDPTNLFGTPYRAKHSNGVEIILDMATLNGEPSITEGVKVSWKPLLQYSVETKLAGELRLSLPAKELLVFFKSNALVSRTRQLLTFKGDTNYLESKVWKDAFDILALADTGLNEAKLREVGKQTGFSPILDKAKQIIADSYDGYGFTQFTFSKRFLEENEAS